MRHKDASTELLGRCLLSLLVGQSLRLPTTPLPTLKIRTARSGPETRDTSTVWLLNQHVSHLTLKCSLWEKHNGLFVEVTFSVTCNQKQSFLLTFIKPDAIANLFLRLSFLRLELPVGFQTVCKRKKKVSLHSSWDHMPSKSIPLKVYPNFKEPLFYEIHFINFYFLVCPFSFLRNVCHARISKDVLLCSRRMYCC